MHQSTLNESLEVKLVADKIKSNSNSQPTFPMSAGLLEDRVSSADLTHSLDGGDSQCIYTMGSSSELMQGMAQRTVLLPFTWPLLNSFQYGELWLHVMCACPCQHVGIIMESVITHQLAVCRSLNAYSCLRTSKQPS